ncbi:MAG: Two-component system sensor histidine kinase [uncultured Cytophagales bacterium]|uniref:histidine kinase n=1 Tax=uncultured Cytophagales bacterium TaxID=158755 RepID=A0A6J4JT49_9SPHI|nr:MAG: Two-component system sensor histidine kinase [uncultured Cytophagales bacterium]
MRYFSSPALLPVLLFTLLTVAVHAQPIPRAEADSLLRLLQAGKADTNRVSQFIRLGEYQVYKPGEFKADMDSARSYAEQANGLSRQLKFYSGESRSLNLLGTISREARQLEQSVGYHQAALRLYHQRGDWKGQADSYLLLAWTYRDKGEAAEARKQAQKAIALYTGKGYPKGVGQAHIEMGNTYANWGEELDTKINFYQQALDWFAKAKDKRKQADVHKDLGDLYQLQGKHAHALIELRKALVLYRAINYPYLQGVYDLLGNVSSGLGDYQEGLKYGLLAVEKAEQLRDTTLELCTIYNRIGITYFYLKQYQKSLIYYNKAMLVAKKYNDRFSISVLTSNTAFVLSKLGQLKAAERLLLSTARQFPPQNSSDSIILAGDLVNIYTELKQYPLAQLYCNQLLVLSSNLGKNDNDRGIIYDKIIPFFIDSKQYRQAREHLAELKEYSTNVKSLKLASNAQLYWFRLDSLQGRYASAIRHYQQHKQLQDSLYNETKSRQIANLDVLYETEKKEQDIKLKEQSIKTLTRERQLQAKQIEQDQLVRNTLIGGAVLMLALLGVTYNRYRLKQRSNQLLKAQQQELQARQEVINQKNEHLSELLTDKESLLAQKDTLIEEKVGLLKDKDSLLTGQQRLLEEKEDLLKEKDVLLEEKERLLKEIHHRVKNNLQIVMSLLNSQAASLKDHAALSAIRESQHRVQAMALIHQKLYQSEGVARIPMRAYLHEVVSYLHESYALVAPVRFELQIEPIELDVTQAVPLGLIINEALTNAFKYAFPGGRRGTIRLELVRLASATYHYGLTIADDGVGLPEGFKPSRSRSLGMTLLHGFARQLGGELALAGPPGLCICLQFGEVPFGEDAYQQEPQTNSQVMHPAG